MKFKNLCLFTVLAFFAGSTSQADDQAQTTSGYLASEAFQRTHWTFLDTGTPGP